MSRDRQGARLRATAAEVVDAVVTSGKSLDAALSARESGVAKEDRGLLRLLCYGTLAGGFLTERWLGEPDPGFVFENRSLVKALPALERILHEAGEALRRSGVPPSPGITALFNAGDEAERGIAFDLPGDQEQAVGAFLSRSGTSSEPCCCAASGKRSVPRTSSATS